MVFAEEMNLMAAAQEAMIAHDAFEDAKTYSPSNVGVQEATAMEWDREASVELRFARERFTASQSGKLIVPQLAQAA